jgi:uncharacterized membrane protein
MPVGLEVESIGPVDVAVIMFEGNQFNGDVAPALADLHDSGTVRVIDVAFVVKDAEGDTAIVEVGDADVADAFERIGGAQFDLLNDEDLADIAEGLKPSSSALVIVWENSWAARFTTAVRESHGELIALERIPRENVMRAVAALDED